MTDCTARFRSVWRGSGSVESFVIFASANCHNGRYFAMLVNLKSRESRRASDKPKMVTWKTGTDGMRSIYTLGLSFSSSSFSLLLSLQL